MEKEREKSYNGSYLYRLNEELSGQAELDPYFISSSAADGGDESGDPENPGGGETDDRGWLSDEEKTDF